MPLGPGLLGFTSRPGPQGPPSSGQMTQLLLMFLTGGLGGGSAGAGAAGAAGAGSGLDAAGGGNPAFANALDGPPSGMAAAGAQTPFNPTSFRGVAGAPRLPLNLDGSLYSGTTGAPTTTGGGTVGPGGNNVGMGANQGQVSSTKNMNPILKSMLDSFFNNAMKRPSGPQAAYTSSSPARNRIRDAYSTGGRLSLPTLGGVYGTA